MTCLEYLYSALGLTRTGRSIKFRLKIPASIGPELAECNNND